MLWVGTNKKPGDVQHEKYYNNFYCFEINIYITLYYNVFLLE